MLYLIHNFKYHIISFNAIACFLFTHKQKEAHYVSITTTERYLGKISDVEAMKWIDKLYA